MKWSIVIDCSKARMHAIRGEKGQAIAAADRKKLKALRREYHRLNRRIRGASV